MWYASAAGAAAAALVRKHCASPITTTSAPRGCNNRPSLHLPRLQQLHILLLRRGSIAYASGLADMHRLLRRIVTSRNVPTCLPAFALGTGCRIGFQRCGGFWCSFLLGGAVVVALAWRAGRRSPGLQETAFKDSRRPQTDAPLHLQMPY